MKTDFPLLLLACIGCLGNAAFAFEPPLQPVSFPRVHLDAESFWGQRQAAIRVGTLTQNWQQCDQTGRFANFDRAAGKLVGKFEGYFFNDSDVYKALEGAIYLWQLQPDAALKTQIDELIARIAAAQQPDGYLNTYFTLTPAEPRWGDIANKHELYCAGHLIEAAVAHFDATGQRSLLDVAIRLADHIDQTFGPGRKLDPCGHPEVELALIRLHRATAEPRYLELARFFVNQRGSSKGRKLFGEYAQDHRPVRAQTEVVGHAVRAMYLYSAVADLAGIDGDEALRHAAERIWSDLTFRKSYVTGGIGSSSHNEGFTRAYDLPNEEAYAETCAGIASVLFNHRMNLLTRDAKYVDALERALYNGVLSGLSLDGQRFFYVNPLASRGNHHRLEWYACACCPPNLLRLFASVGNYVYATGANAVYVNLYAAGEAEIPLGENRVVKIRQQTRYPWDGRVELTITPPASAPAVALYLRLPGWAEASAVRLNGTAASAEPNGYIAAGSDWKPGQTLVLELPMPVRRVRANPLVDANRGRVALQRGPIVYCAEAEDNDGKVWNRALPPGAEISAEFDSRLLGGVTVLKAAAESAPDVDWDASLYSSAPPVGGSTLTFIPYFAWDNRGAGEMAVWIPESVSVLDPQPIAWLRPSASYCNENDQLEALHDRLEPANSDDHSIPRMTFWPHRGTAEWLQYDFEQPRRIRGVEVYWFDDSPRKGHCRPPQSWKLLLRRAGSWTEVESSAAPGTALNQYNSFRFEPIETDGLRIEMQLQPEWSGGALEWKVLTD